MKAKSLLAGMTVALAMLSTSAQTISTEYAQPGIGGKVLPEFRTNEYIEVLDLPINSQLSQAGSTVASREKWLNDNNVGLQILASYLTDQTSYDKMKADVRKSITQADLDDAAFSGLGEEAMINGILVRRLSNNYIFFANTHSDGKTYWEIYKIQLTPELYNAYINVMGTNEAKPQIPMKFIKSGKYDQKKIDEEYAAATTSSHSDDQYAVFRRLAKDVPDLAIGGPVINSHPYLARVPQTANREKLQRYYIYRTVEKNGQLKSKNVGTSFVTRAIGQDTIQLYSLFGRTGSKKRGDYAVLTPGGRNSISVSGMYGFEKNGNYPGVRLEYDNMHMLTPQGISGHILGTIDVDFIGRSSLASDTDEGETFTYLNVKDEKVYATHPNPLRLGIGLGYGVGFNFMGRFQLMPYVRINATYTTFLSVHHDEELGTLIGAKDGNYLPIADDNGMPDLSEDNEAEFFGVRGDLGAKFQVNITKEFSFFVGAEYNYHKGFGKKTTAGISAADYFYKKDYLGHGTSSFNLMAGVRIVLF